MAKMNFICEDCGKKAEPDPEKSTPRWEVLPVRCSCGGKWKISLAQK